MFTDLISHFVRVSYTVPGTQLLGRAFVWYRDLGAGALWRLVANGNACYRRTRVYIYLHS